MGDHSENSGLERSEYRQIKGQWSRQLRRWSWVLGSVSVMSLLPVMPAIAAELSQWGYDLQTRSLTLVLSTSVTPTVSVLSDNQLLIELPDTQVGNVLAQQVNDGIVDSIVVKQTSPDTVWMVIAFLPGTVLADSQALAPIGAADAPGPNLQQWQVSPALLSSSSASTQTNTQANTQASNQATGSADSRQTETPAATRELAQLPDFPDLPVLAPANPIEAPVSVPLPVNLLPASLPSANQPPVNQPPVNQPLSNLPTAAADNDGLPSLVSIPSVSVPSVSVPSIPTRPIEAQPVETVLETMPIQLPVGQVPLPPTPAVSEPVVAEPVASEPEIAEPIAAEPVVEPVATEPVASEPVAAPEPLQPVAEIVPSSTKEPVVPVEPPFIGALGDLTMPIPLPDDLIEADESPTPPATLMPSVVAEPAEPVAIEPNPSPTPITPANVNRWPDPIPFGQPLP